MNWKRMWTVSYCECRGAGMVICLDCEMPCDHDQLCPQCRGYEWYAHRVRDVIDFLTAKDVGWLYRTKRDAFASIEIQN